MPVVNIPAPKVIPAPDYTELGKYLAMAINPQGYARAQALPEIYKQQALLEFKRKQQSDLLSRLEAGGNGPSGQWDITFDEFGNIKSYRQRPFKQQLEERQAREDLGFYQGQPAQAPVLPQAVSQLPVEASTTPPTAVPPGVPGLPPSERRKLQAEQAVQTIKAKGKEKAEELKRGRQLKETVNAFRGVVSQYKGMIEERAGGETGLIPGLIGAAKAKTFQKGVPRTAAFEGQRTETTFRLNSILTGQNRVIRGVIGMIQETLPTRLDPADMAAQKVAQSISNAYKLTKAFKQSGLSPDNLNAMSQEELDNIPVESLVSGYDLSPIENKELEALISDVLATKAEKERAFPEFSMPSVVKQATDKRTQYNRLRGQGVSAAEAKKRLGL